MNKVDTFSETMEDVFEACGNAWTGIGNSVESATWYSKSGLWEWPIIRTIQIGVFMPTAAAILVFGTGFAVVKAFVVK